jgi:hypothetical protein
MSTGWVELPDGWTIWHRRTLGGQDTSCLEHRCGLTLRLGATLGELQDHVCPRYWGER